MSYLKSILFGLIIAQLIFISCSQQNESGLKQYTAERCTSKARKQFSGRLIETEIIAVLRGPLNPETTEKWQGAFWAMGLTRFKSDETKAALDRLLNNFTQHSAGLKRAVLEVICTLYPNEFGQEMQHIAEVTENPKLFAMAAHYLLKNHLRSINASAIRDLIIEKFPAWQAEPVLFMLMHYLKQSPQARLHKRPNLVDILRHPFEKDKIVIFSFQRLNRSYPGLTVIRKSNGKFLRNPDGTFFHIAHLARSNSGMPGYITNGNTPQGIFSIQGTGSSENVFIGPAKTLQLTMPVESDVKTYFHKENEINGWNPALYGKLLPDSWQSYFPVYEAYYAGAAGRTEIIAHGTTINPEYYRNAPYYPNTPSLGCITAMELWDENDGRCLYSDQQALINAYQQAGGGKGYFVLLELDDRQDRVHLYELLPDLLKAEDNKK